MFIWFDMRLVITDNLVWVCLICLPSSVCNLIWVYSSILLHVLCVHTHLVCVFYQDTRIFWLVTGFMFLGSGMIWRRLLSFLGRHLEPSVPPLVIHTHTCTLTPDESVIEDQVLRVISPICDTDHSSLEEKSEIIRHEDGGQMMVHLQSVKCIRPPECSFRDECFIHIYATALLLYSAMFFSRGWVWGLRCLMCAFVSPTLLVVCFQYFKLDSWFRCLHISLYGWHCLSVLLFHLWL